MRLRNKKTGEIPEKIETITYIQWSKKIMMVYINNSGERIMKYYNSLEAFNEEWEDYEEPKEYWYIDYDGGILLGEEDNSSAEKMMISMGNHFESLEEAEKAVEKLKAWKRLRDNGLTFKNWSRNQTGTIDCFANWDERIPPSRHSYELQEDLDLLFGGEE